MRAPDAQLTRHKGTAPAIQSVAILPFENANTDPDTEYLSDGITETTIVRLSQLSGVKVIARSSAFRYKGREIDPAAVGRELGVDAVVLGRVEQRGTELTITAELVDTADSSLLWSERYSRSLSDILSMQREIAADITRSLQVRLTSEDEERLTKRTKSLQPRTVAALARSKRRSTVRSRQCVLEVHSEWTTPRVRRFLGKARPMRVYGSGGPMPTRIERSPSTSSGDTREAEEPPRTPSILDGGVRDRHPAKRGGDRPGSRGRARRSGPAQRDGRGKPTGQPAGR